MGKSKIDTSNIYNKVPKICIPYNDTYFQKLSNIFKEFNVHTLPLVEKSLNSIIKLGKDKTDKWDQTNVVYKFDCSNCSAIYIGQTKRSLKTRITEHMKNTNSESVVCQHRQIPNHEFDWNNVKILDHEHDYKKRAISEMIHIKTNNFTINKKEDIIFLNKSLFPLLNKLNS